MAEQSLSRQHVLAPPTDHRGTGGHGDARWRLVLLLLALSGVVVLGGWALAQPEHPVMLIVNGEGRLLRSRQRSVGGVLRAQGYHLAPQDIVYPHPSTPLPLSQPATLLLARDMTLSVDGSVHRVLTQAERVGELLLALDISLGARDRVLLDGRVVTPESRLPLLPGPDGRPRGTLVVERAVPIVVAEDGLTLNVTTRARTVGEALLEQEIRLFEGDQVTPDLAARVGSGLVVRIHRSRPYRLAVDGKAIYSRSGVGTVGELLASHEITLGALDRVSTPLDSRITAGIAITVTRVSEERVVERHPIPFEREWVARSDWELDHRELLQAGQSGTRVRELQVVYEDGREVARRVEQERVETPPRHEVTGYGTRVVIRPISTAQGTRHYWRHLRLHATSYTAATSGKSPDHPEYGITQSGRRSGFGIVAVDPRVIPLNSPLYIPGYGVAVAGDTGGAIKGARIDLGYPDCCLRDWYQWVDVYLLTPIPPADQIRYLLP